MGVSRENTYAYERGKNDREWENEHPYVSFFLWFVDSVFGIGICPSDSSKASAYDKGHSGKQFDSDSGSSDSSSCCHITTACLDAIGKPRNSLEMMAMGELAREYTLKSFKGKRDYVLYRRNAPALVKAISERSDAREIWGRVYEKLRRVTSTVLSKDYAKAQEQYRELVVGLESKYA